MLSTTSVTRRSVETQGIFDALNLSRFTKQSLTFQLRTCYIREGRNVYTVSKQELQKLEGILQVFFPALILVVWIVLCDQFSDRVDKRFALP